MTTITSLPAPPSRQDPANFATRGDAFFGALPTMVSEVNAVAAEIASSVGAAASSASSASVSAGNASASAQSAAASLSAIQTVTGMTPVTVTGTSVACSAGNLYIMTNASATTATLPASPSDGAVVGFDAGNMRKDNIVARNGKTIMGVAEDLTLDRFPLTLIYRAALGGWRFV